MSKIAIAGSGGLAQHIAQFITSETTYSCIILSRQPNENLARRCQCQVIAVNYEDRRSLGFTLRGVDTVISTISGRAQLQLIDAAVREKVRRFAPAEFEGSPSFRPFPDPLDFGKSAALERLRYYSDPRHEHRLQYTVFVCGIFYERFSPGGLASKSIGLSSGISQEGAYLMDIRNGRAQIPHVPGAIEYPYVRMTALADVARFVVRALEMPEWPPELQMYGERWSVDQIVQHAEYLKGGHYFYRQPGDTTVLRSAQALAAHNYAEQLRLQHLIATAEGRYDYSGPFLNAVVDFQPMTFRDWLRAAWAGQ